MQREKWSHAIGPAACYPLARSLVRSLTRLPACCCLLGEPETTDSDVTDRRANSPLVRGRLTPILSIVHWQCNDKRTDNRFYTTNSCPLRVDNGISLCLRLTDGPLKLFQSGTKRRSAPETHAKILRRR